MGPGHRGVIGTSAWSQESGYDMFNWERLEYPFADWLTFQDLELLMGDMHRYFPGSIRFNQLLRHINKDIGLLHLEGSLLGFSDQDDRRANRLVMVQGRSVREVSLLDQAVSYSELGLRPGQGSIDDQVLLQCRTLVTRNAPLNLSLWMRRLQRAVTRTILEMKLTAAF